MADLPSYETLLIERGESGITTLYLNRPHKKNAINPQLHEDMYDALLRLENDRDTSVLIITGKGDTFCAGWDLKEMFRDVSDDMETRDSRRRIVDWAERIVKFYAKPTIAMINGGCYAAGFQIVSSCDVAIAADEAMFALSEVNFGTIPAGMAAKDVLTTMPYRDALWYSMSGQRFDAKRAAEIRFVNWSVPLAQLRDKTMEVARHFAKLDPEALRGSKECVKHTVWMTDQEARWYTTAKSGEVQYRRQKRGLSNEGIDAFLNKEYKPGMGSYTEAKSMREREKKPG